LGVTQSGANNEGVSMLESKLTLTAIDVALVNLSSFQAILMRIAAASF